MEGVYPIVIDGEIAGKLTVRAAGGRTVFSAVCRPLEGVVRISVYGGGREGYLGVLAPEGDALTLEKSFSRAALRDFPAEIERVERAGMQTLPLPPERETPPEPESEPEPLPEDTSGLSWYASPDGALVAHDGARDLIALPVGDGRIPPNVPGRERTIEGKDYVVYITKDGRVVR